LVLDYLRVLFAQHPGQPANHGTITAFASGSRRPGLAFSRLLAPSHP
jgi:hypothetical protein